MSGGKGLEKNEIFVRLDRRYLFTNTRSTSAWRSTRVGGLPSSDADGQQDAEGKSNERCHDKTARGREVPNLKLRKRKSLGGPIVYFPTTSLAAT